jgi:hypothetical protein
VPCTGAADRCENCALDLGNWFGDCDSCKPGFFRQFDAGTCLDFCPTGSIPNLITNECSNPGLDGPISNVVFNKLGPIYKGLPFGQYKLKPGFEAGHEAPQNTVTRGLFFDGGSGYVNIEGLNLNTKFSVHFWVYFFSF